MPIQPLPPDDVRARIHALWDELAGFEAAESDAALLYLLGGVAALICAQNAFWIGVLRMTDGQGDPLLGWRARAIRYLHPSDADESYARESIRKMGGGAHEESTIAHARLAGQFRALLQRDLVSPAWFASVTYKYGYEPRGIIDILTVGAPVNTSAESYYGFHRKRPHPPFTPADRDTAAYAMRSLTWFHRQVMLSHGLLAARAPLSPTERRVLALLLTDKAEKQIADELGLTVSTTHTYVREVFRKFGVSGRAGVTALWLGKAR